ncbi:MAG: hypothetical protein ACMXYL_04100 [Candidatus Woesearchaeota archaeon]
MLINRIKDLIIRPARTEEINYQGVKQLLESLEDDMKVRIKHYSNLDAKRGKTIIEGEPVSGKEYLEGVVRQVGNRYIDAQHSVYDRKGKEYHKITIKQGLKLKMPEGDHKHRPLDIIIIDYHSKQ